MIRRVYNCYNYVYNYNETSIYLRKLYPYSVSWLYSILRAQYLCSFFKFINRI